MSQNYVVVRVAGSLVALELAVKDRCKDGWQPQGGPFRDNDSLQWCQAMTRVVAQPEDSSALSLREPAPPADPPKRSGEKTTRSKR